MAARSLGLPGPEGRDLCPPRWSARPCSVWFVIPRIWLATQKRPLHAALIRCTSTSISHLPATRRHEGILAKGTASATIRKTVVPFHA